MCSLANHILADENFNQLPECTLFIPFQIFWVLSGHFPTEGFKIFPVAKVYECPWVE